MGNGDEDLNETNSIKQLENEQEYAASLADARITAENYVLDRFDVVSKMNASSCAVPFEEVLDVAAHDLDFHSAIWEASTVILPNLEVQVVIDAHNKCYVTTGSAGYVGEEWEKGLNLPLGLRLPIRCWIHTHPFGSAYFSGTDISTVTRFQPIMEQAYVLGGEGHYGFWEQSRPEELDVYNEGSLDYTQRWGVMGEEE
tara:strand:- start:5405 stop:6001 length:597 start_codon:yes stop_codon:yes gene_type:complete